MQQIEFNVFYLIRSVKKHFKTFLAINIIVLAASVFYVLTATVQYESKTVFYPYSPESSDPRIMLYGEEVEFMVFGYNDQVERYSKIGLSNAIKYYLAKKYNLYQRYGIDTSDMELANFKLVDRMYEVLTLKKGEQGSVNISVLDPDKDLAAKMCNDVINQIDSINGAIFIEKNIKVFNLYKSQLAALEAGVQSLKDSISLALQSKSKSSAKNVEIFQAQLNYSIAEYAKTKTKYELTKTFTNTRLKTLFLTEPAQPSHHKARPMRKLIVGGAFVVGLIFSTLLFTIIEFVKDNREKFVL